MIQIGKYQELEVRRLSDYGAYLGSADDAAEVLLPNRYLTPEIKVGDTIKVFIYKDSEDRPVATTEHPFATVGEFAFLQVSQVNDIGAFMDWGLPKDLLVPYSEQRVRMRKGGFYLVYIYIDSNTGRLVASAKIEKFLGNVFPAYKVGDEVEALVYEHNEIGYKVIVDNLHRGIIYANEIYRPIELEQSIKAFVKQVRPDGKIDLTLNDAAPRRVASLADRILAHLQDEAGSLSEKMSPFQIETLFSCSKKDFKKAVGQLYRERKVIISPEGIVNLADNAKNA